MTSKQKRKEQQQRDRILRAAAKVLTKKAYSDVTLDEVGKAMKSTKGTIYYYFPSKAEILYQLHSRILELGHASVKQVLEENDSLPVERLRRAIWCHAKTVISNAWLTKVFVRTVDLQNLPIRLRRRIRDLRRSYVTIFEGLIREAATASGSLCDADARLLSFVILDGINWIPQWYSEEGKLSPDELADILSEMFMGGLCHLECVRDPLQVAAALANAGDDNKALTKTEAALERRPRHVPFTQIED